MPEVNAAYRPFQAQLDAFRQRVNIPTERWDDLMHGDHAHGFMIAGLARADVLEDMRQAIEAAIANGETLDDFRERFEDVVAGRWSGWTGESTPAGRAWRTRIIYRTNLRTSMMAGRWETLRQFAALQYQHNTIANPREEHEAWDGLIIAADDPWWDSHYPPNGWGCACSVTGVSPQRLRAMGRDLDRAPPPSAGDPPPEWAYHVGKSSRSLSAASALADKVATMPAAWRDQVLADAASRPEIFAREWAATLRAVLGGAAPIGAASPVGWTSASAHAAGRATSPRLVAGVDSLGAALGADAAVVAPILRELPRRLLDSSTQVMRNRNALAYAIELPDGRVLLLPLEAAGQGSGISALFMRALQVMSRAELRSSGWDAVATGGPP